MEITRGAKMGGKYTSGEEIAHSVSHGIGAALSIAGLVVSVALSAQTGDRMKILSFAIFGASMVALYTASMLYHAITHEKAKILFRYLDHISIFLLIAGTYTPIALLLLKGAWSWMLFGIVWGLAMAGIAYQVFYLNQHKWISISIYLLLGWIALAAIKPLAEVMPFGLFMWILAGGLFYTVGAVFYLKDNYRYFHFVWHLFVIGGTLCNFLGMINYLI